jgi:hypothetical protein
METSIFVSETYCRWDGKLKTLGFFVVLDFAVYLEGLRGTKTVTIKW